MDIVKKLNPFKRLHALQGAPVGPPYDSEVSSGRHQTQTPIPRSGFGRDSERKRNARAAATEKELIHLNHKIVSIYPFDAHCCHTGTAIKHPVPSFVIFDIWAL